MQITLELRALLKVTLKAHSELQVMLIDIQQYKPTWAMGGTSASAQRVGVPKQQRMGKWDEPHDPVDLDNMHITKSDLGKVSLPPKACFVLGKVVHVQFDGRS